MASGVSITAVFGYIMELSIEERRELEKWLHAANTAEIELDPFSVREQDADSIGALFGTRAGLPPPWSKIKREPQP